MCLNVYFNDDFFLRNNEGPFFQFVKGSFLSESLMRLKKCAKSLSWAENLNFPPWTANHIFKLSAQDSDLAHFLSCMKLSDQKLTLLKSILSTSFRWLKNFSGVIFTWRCKKYCSLKSVITHYEYLSTSIKHFCYFQNRIQRNLIWLKVRTASFCS